jgi:hypothetical protein
LNTYDYDAWIDGKTIDGMSQREGLTILLDAVRQLPETPHLKRAIKWGDKRLEVLQGRHQKYLSRQQKKNTNP